MQQVKRKGADSEATSPKKKKVQFARHDGDEKVDKKKVSPDKNKKHFTKDRPVGVKKFNKPNTNYKGKKPELNKVNNYKGKKPFIKDFNKTKGSNDQPKGSTEKPKWSEMKKEKKELRVVRRKAKATAEVFEISHKAKLLAAQIQR